MNNSYRFSLCGLDHHLIEPLIRLAQAQQSAFYSWTKIFQSTLQLTQHSGWLDRPLANSIRSRIPFLLGLRLVSQSKGLVSSLIMDYN